MKGFSNFPMRFLARLLSGLLLIVSLGFPALGQESISYFAHNQDGWVLADGGGTIIELGVPGGPGLTDIKTHRQAYKWSDSDSIQIQTVNGVSKLHMQSHTWPLLTAGCTYDATFKVKSSTGMKDGKVGTKKEPLGFADGSFVYDWNGVLEGDFTFNGSTVPLTAYFSEKTWPQVTEDFFPVQDMGGLTLILVGYNKPLQDALTQALASDPHPDWLFSIH